MPAIHLVIKGKVQGVYFRASAMKKARILSITGWVKNMDDGAVEIIANGDAEALEQLKDWCYTGPPASVVHEIKITDIGEQSFSSFIIKR